MSVDNVAEFLEAIIQIGDLFHRRYLEGLELNKKGLPPEAPMLTAERLHSAWQLKDYSASFYKSCKSIRQQLDNAMSNSFDTTPLRPYIFVAVQFITSDILFRLSIWAYKILSDTELTHYVLGKHWERSPMYKIVMKEGHLARLHEVYGLSPIEYETDSKLLRVIGHSMAVGEGLEYFADCYMQELLPAMEGISPLPTYIKQNGFSGLYIRLCEEINRCYATGSYIATAFLCRRILENLVFGILQKRFSTDQNTYLKPNNEPKSFFNLIETMLTEKIDHFQGLFPGNARIEDVKSSLHKFRKKFNVDIHQLGSIPIKTELDSFKSEFDVVIDILLHIYNLP